MTPSTATFLSIMINIATTAGGAHAARVPQSPPAIARPQIVFPRVTRPGPPSANNKNLIVGPTDDISSVANHRDVQAKSLNTLVTIAPGLTLIKPVTISIAYLTPFPAGNDRRTETYNATKGNSFLYSDLEANGKQRKIHMDITFSEAKAGGGIVSYNLPMDFTLDPLYDVEFSPLVFTLVTGCANVGANQIDLNWYSPETREKLNLNFQTVHFATKERETFNIREFSWSRSEVSAAADLRKVVVWYVENEVPISFAPVPSPSEENLVPGKTHGSNVGLIQSIGGSTIGGKCWATLDYTVTYQLRTFLGAPEVRDHR